MKKYKPAKSWLKEYYKCDKSIVSVDKTEYDYPSNLKLYRCRILFKQNYQNFK